MELRQTRFYGGPKDGELVEYIDMGVTLASIQFVQWPQGSYVWSKTREQFEWQINTPPQSNQV